jgi:hypothetical protein
VTVLYRIVTTHTGFTGSPGYTNLFFETTDPVAAGAQAAADKVRNFWEAVGATMAGPWRYAIAAAVDTIDDTNGHIQDTVSITPLTQSVFGVAGAYAAVAGGVIVWRTSTLRPSGTPGKGPKRLQGRTFIVPMSGGSYDTDGSLSALTITRLQTGAGILLGSGPAFRVWGRPRGAGASNGLSAVVTAFRVPDMSAELRSRRD